MTGPNSRAFFKSISFAVVVVTLAAGLMWFLEDRGWFDGLEGITFDWQHRLTRTRSSREPPSNIVVIDIDDDSYATCFDNSSPLQTAKMLSLVDRALAKRATVVGVDVITDSKEYSRSYSEHSHPSLNPAAPVVWAVQLLTTPEGGSHEKDAESHSAGHGLELYAGPVLGFKALSEVSPTEHDNVPEGVIWAPPIFPQEGDLRIRRYPRYIPISKPGSTFENPFEARTWARTIAEEYSHRSGQRFGNGAKQVYLLHRTAADWVPASRILGKENCPGASEKGGRTDTGLGRLLKSEETNAGFDGRIVLVGGTFRQSRDSYHTANGEMSGIAINAAAIEAELRGDYLNEIPRYIIFLLDVLVGVLLIHLDRRLGHGRLRNKAFRILVAALALFFVSTAMAAVDILWLSWIGMMLGLLLVFLVDIYVANPELE